MHCIAAVQLVLATVQLYNAIRTELLPTPNKSHYTFNLRDMGKVVQGLMRADPKTLGTQQQVRPACVTYGTAYGPASAFLPMASFMWTVMHPLCQQLGSCLSERSPFLAL